MILAAGMSKRMGKPKLLLEINKKPILHYVLDVAKGLSLSPIILVTGCYKDKMHDLVKEYGHIQLVYNPRYAEGMSSSLRLGINSIKDKVDAALIFLGDQPFVSQFVVQSLIKQYEKQTKYLIFRPKYEGVLGHPVLFNASLFPDFAYIYGDEGGKRIIDQHRHLLKIVSFNHRVWGDDVDTPDDFTRMKGYLNR